MLNASRVCVVLYDCIKEQYKQQKEEDDDDKMLTVHIAQ
jgi:hypothetical protein